MVVTLRAGLRAAGLGVGIFASLAACGKVPPRAADTASPSAGTGAVAATASGTRPPAGAVPAEGCPRTGHWSECLIKHRLEQSGLAPRLTKEKIGELPEMSGVPLIYLVGNAGMAIYLYPDSAARRAAAAKLDTAKFIPPSRDLSMRGEGTAIQNDNALVLLFTRNEHQRERVADAVTAGPPQP